MLARDARSRRLLLCRLGLDCAVVAKLIGMLFGLADKILRIVTRLPIINLSSAIGGIPGF